MQDISVKASTTQAPAAPANGVGEPSIAELRIPAVAFHNVVGSSSAIRKVIDLGCKVAGHPGTTVLIQGETGTGKELFARGVHYSGPSAADPFVAINCSAIPEHLLESELFGHEKGAFTGADTQKRGLFEFAGDGTVFLDEIGELPQSLQPKLLRALEERKVRRVGGLKEIDIGCRVIAATNRDLSTFVQDGHFRADLFYRLSVFRLELPPLRDRVGDIDVLARFFVDNICREHGVPAKRISPEAAELLRKYRWPGNVRELKNALEGAMIVCDADTIAPEHIAIRPRGHAEVALAATPSTHDDGDVIRIPKTGLTLNEAERQLLESTLRMANFNQSLAARMLGVSRPTIVRMMQKHGFRTRRDLVAD
jgi:transcriptional regulator with GAF, ATPase, and Fis domain